MSVFKFSLAFTFLFILTISVFALVCAADSDEAALTIERAEDVVVSSYQVALEAESAGANVSILLDRLNEAGELLAKARVSYRVGDFDGAVRFAELSEEIGENVRVDTLRVKDLAVYKTVNRFWWTLVRSIVGVAIVVILSFFGWLIFKGRYYRRVLRMRPEVVSGGS